MGMGSSGGGSRAVPYINVTPLIDVLLVVLIIFMVVTPLLQHGVTVNLPKDMKNPDEDQRIIASNAIVIAIPNNGEYYLGKERVSKEQVKDRVDTMLKNIKKEEDKVVYIKSGIGVDYGDVVNVINEVCALGIDKIGLVADKKKGGPPPPGGKPAT